MKIYIAGKITDYPEYKDKFNAAEESIRAAGDIAVNPAKLNDILGDNFEHDEYMQVCYRLIDLCDGIFLLDNWHDSIGARLERAYATIKDKKIIYQESVKK